MSFYLKSITVWLELSIEYGKAELFQNRGKAKIMRTDIIVINISSFISCKSSVLITQSSAKPLRADNIAGSIYR